jgi:predicted GIY-YIG superfamily endonuclease
MASSSMAFVYILRCADGSLYVGSCANLETRIPSIKPASSRPITRRLPRRNRAAAEAGNNCPRIYSHVVQ